MEKLSIISPNGKLNKERIEQELLRVIEWPDLDNKTYVTKASTLIFAEIIAGLVYVEVMDHVGKTTDSLENGDKQ